MTLSEKKQEKIADMLNAGESIRKIETTLHISKSAVQDYKKIFNASVSGCSLPPRLQKVYNSPRIEHFTSYIYTIQGKQHYTTGENNLFHPVNKPRNTYSSTTDVPTNHQILVQALLQDLEDSEKKITEQKHTITQITDQLTQAEKQVDQLQRQGEQKDKKIEQLTQKTITLTKELETKIQEIEKLQDIVKKQEDLQEKTKQDHQRAQYELEGEKNQVITTMQENHHKELQKCKTIIETNNKKIGDLEYENQIITADRDKFKAEVNRLQKNHENDLFKFAAVGVGGILFGSAVGLLLGSRTNQPLPLQIDEGKNTPPIYKIVPIPEIDTMQDDTSLTTGGVITTTNTSGSQCTGTFVSNPQGTHPPQDLQTNQAPSPNQISLYLYIPLPSPLPNDLSEVYPMNQWMRTTGLAFERCIGGLFVHKGCPTEHLTYGNPHGDLIVTLNGVPTLIECKQQPKVGVNAIQRTYASKDHYPDKGVTHCIVITTGEFTKTAREEANKLGVDLWDGKRLVEEIYKAQFFYVPENASDYDPNK